MGALHSLYHLNRLKRRLFWSANKLESLRRKKLTLLLNHCYQHIPYYQEQFKKIGAQPGDFQTPEDLANFPILEKETLRDRSEEFFDPKADRNSWIRYSSSGSTGIPLTLWYYPAERQRMGFTITRTFLFHGLKPWYNMANITEPRHFTPKNRWYHRLGLMNERFLSIFDRVDSNLVRLREIEPQLLIGFPSILILIGQKMMEEALPPLRPKFLFTIAEVLTSDYRDVLTEQWGIAPIDIYGANEAGTIAFQCSRRENYHINVDSVHVDIMIGDRPAKVDERGEVVVTNLDLRVMPIIRYRVGDIAQKIEENCPCECSFPLMGKIAGRSDGFVIGANGKLFSALEVSLLMHPIQGIKHYRLVQEKYGHVRVEWVAKNRNSNSENEILLLLKKHLGAETTIEVRKVTEIRRERSGKIRSVISNLPHPFRQNGV
jgi:phenylacetate-CoA ligase